MKKILCFLLVLLLPLCALAEAPAATESDISLPLPGENPAIADCLPLPDGGALLNVLTTDALDGASMDMLYLLRIDAAGEILWQTRYHAFTGHSSIDRYTLALSQDSVTVTHCTDLLGNDHCTRTSITFDLASGKQEDEIDVYSIPAEEMPTITHCGDYRVEEFFGDYEESAVRTLITHIPTGRTAEYALGGNLTWTAFGDKLLCFSTDSEDRGSYWLYDKTCLPVVEEEHTPFGAGHRQVTHAVQSNGWLYLFVWLDGADPDVRTYAVYLMDEQLRFGDSIALFTLAEGHSLADAAVCGDGFLITEYFPWEWQQPAKNALSYLSKDGALTVLVPELVFPRSDAARLLPGTDDSHARVILRDGTEPGYRHQLYAAQ